MLLVINSIYGIETIAQIFKILSRIDIHFGVIRGKKIHEIMIILDPNNIKSLCMIISHQRENSIQSRL